MRREDCREDAETRRMARHQDTRHRRCIYARRQGVRWPQIKPPEHLVDFEFASMEGMIDAGGLKIERRQAVGGTGILAAMSGTFGPIACWTVERRLER